MSDARLRDLERRWRESSTVEDVVRYLLERLRVGDLQHDRLALAAYCQHEPARLALGGRELVPEEATEHDWVVGLADFGREAGFRAGLAISRCVVAAWHRRGATPLDEATVLGQLLEPTVLSAERFLVTGHDSDLVDLDTRGENLFAAWRVAYDALPDDLAIIRRRVAITAKDEEFGLVSSARAVAELRRLAVVEETSPGIEGFGRLPGVACGALSTSLTKLVVALDFQLNPATYVAAACAELIPWALGYGDPVRDRVSSRTVAA